MKPEKGRILVVDDNEHNRDLLARHLRRQQHDVVMAEDGREALGLLAAQAFDLILLDIMMPELNGYEVLEQLKADPRLRYIPVIMISAIDDLESVVRCIELGAEDYLPKPFNPTLLRARVGACLEKKWLRDQEQNYLQAVRREMELGRRMQADFLPAELPRPAGWEIAAAFHPAREVAGDFYDAFLLPGERLGLVIADVCDKGVGAALFMVLSRSLLRAFAEQAPPATAAMLGAVELTNAYIARHHFRSRPRMFATLFFGVLDLTTGELMFINGGHPPPVLAGAGGVRALLEPTGPAVGLAAESRFRLEQVQLVAGDYLLAYTDGVTEARNAGGELFAEQRLLALLDGADLNLPALMARVEAGARGHIGPALELEDDITMLGVRRLV